MTELHRWHHSKLMHESNHNYGGNLIVWDILFGTRWLPNDRDPPEAIGMESLPGLPMGFWVLALRGQGAVHDDFFAADIRSIRGGQKGHDAHDFLGLPVGDERTRELADQPEIHALLMSPMTMRAPADANRIAEAFPIPVAAPVTKATWSLKRPIQRSPRVVRLDSSGRVRPDV